MSLPIIWILSDQLEMLALVKELGINSPPLPRDIQLACRFSDYIYLMKGGEIVASNVS